MTWKGIVASRRASSIIPQLGVSPPSSERGAELDPVGSRPLRGDQPVGILDADLDDNARHRRTAAQARATDIARRGASRNGGR